MKFKERLGKVKKNFLPESKKAGMVVLGLVAGSLVNKGIDMFIASSPKLEGAGKFLKPLITGAGGIVISSSADNDSSGKYFGYGITGAGALAGLKLLPFSQDLLSGLDDLTTLPTAYYTESLKELSGSDLGGFGLAVQSMETQPAKAHEVDLPDLEGAGIGCTSYTKDNDDDTEDNIGDGIEDAGYADIV